MVQARTNTSIMGRLPSVVSGLAFCTAANYRGSRDRCLTIKNNYAISIRNHPHSNFEENGRCGLLAWWQEKHLAGDPGCDLTKVRDCRIVRTGIPCRDQLIMREQIVDGSVGDAELPDARYPLRHQRNAKARA